MRGRATILVCLVTLAASQGPGPVAAGGSGEPAPPDSGFARTEQWACPAENQDDFRAYVTEVWAPIFDAMVREERFTSWSSLYPVQTRDVAFGESGATVEEVAEPWGWTGIWYGTGQESFEASWVEYHRRLAAAHPDARGPEHLCTRVRVTTHLLGT